MHGLRGLASKTSICWAYMSIHPHRIIASFSSFAYDLVDICKKLKYY